MTAYERASLSMLLLSPKKKKKQSCILKFFLLCLTLNYFAVPSSSSFTLRKVFNHHKFIHQASQVNWSVESTWPLSSTRDKAKMTTWLKWEGDTPILTDGWWDFYAFPQGWIIQVLSAEETLNIFLLAVISNIIYFFHKEGN